MTASPTALDLARACVMTVAAGVHTSVRVVPPGTDPQHSIHWITVPADLAARYVEEAVATLAPFVDLGMARGRLSQIPAMLPWCPPAVDVIRRAVERAQGDAPAEPPRDIAPEVAHMVGDDDDGEIG